MMLSQRNFCLITYVFQIMRNSLSKSTVDDILRERDDISDISIDYSFTLEDIIKEDDEEEDD